MFWFLYYVILFMAFNVSSGWLYARIRQNGHPVGRYIHGRLASLILAIMISVILWTAPLICLKLFGCFCVFLIIIGGLVLVCTAIHETVKYYAPKLMRNNEEK